MFGEEQTRSILADVCRPLGVSAEPARLIRHHTNAVYEVGEMVVKIAPTHIRVEDLRPVVTLVNWLTDQSFPTVPLVPDVPQPMAVRKHAVTVWQRLKSSKDSPVTTAELGRLLKRLHALPRPPVTPAHFSPINGIRWAIDSSHILSGSERDFLHARLDKFAKLWEEMDSALAPGLIHADPQTGNALRDHQSRPVLADWDTIAIGPREWDLATIAVHCRRFTPTDSEAFGSFVLQYGWDPTSWEHFEDLCRLRELKMITTNARKSADGSPAAREVHRRLTALREDPYDSLTWHIL